jgi:hypothetical protein
MKTTLGKSITFQNLKRLVCPLLVAIFVICRPAFAQELSPRTELLRVLKLQISVAEQMGNPVLVERLQSATDNLYTAREEELPPYVDTADDLKLLGDRLEILDNKLRMGILSEQTKPSTHTENILASPSQTNTHGILLTPAPYFDGGILGVHCLLPDASTGNRFDTELALDAQLVLSVAKVAWAGTEVACGLDVVALGTGGVGALFCIGAAVAVGAAEETVDAFQRCDATVDEAHLDGAFLRAEDNFDLNSLIHHDIMTHDTEVKALLNQLIDNQKLIIKLLKTPQGRRPEWKTEGY